MYLTTKWSLCYCWLFLAHLAITMACRVSEYPCKGSTSICIPLDKYCDGRADCEDGSDEPRHCTVCNRTYYGDIGRTYSIKVPTPQWNKLPFLCHLTFTASGHDQGDIVQIIFDSFTVGRFDEGMVDTDVDGYETSLSPSGELPGCPEGFMQTWNQAFLQCRSLEMDLASFDSKEEFDGVLNAVPSWGSVGTWGLEIPLLGYWVGAIGEQINLAWTSTGNPIIPSFWKPEYQYAESDYCANVKEKFLIKESCSTHYGFICKERGVSNNCCSRTANFLINVKQINK